jgi:hypothetical protein
VTYEYSILYKKNTGKYCISRMKVLELKALNKNGQAYAKRDRYIRVGVLLLLYGNHLDIRYRGEPLDY